MAANIGIGKHGKAAMAYLGEVPWHGLGTKLTGAENSEDVMMAAGLNYTVGLQDMFIRSPYDDFLKVPGKRAVVREDTGAILGVVGEKYEPFQNHECFAFLDEVAGRGFKYHTVGALGAGERVWLLGKLDGTLGILGSNDVSEKYLLLSTSHDGSSTLQVFFTTVRVVCQNTLTMAHKSKKKGEGIFIKHTRNLQERVAEAQEVLGLAKVFYDDLQDNMNKLAGYQVSENCREAYYKWLYPSNKNGEIATRTANIHSELERLFHESPGNNDLTIRGSAWALVNSITDYVDHYRSSRGKDEDSRTENRFESQLWGSGNALKIKAYEGALSLIN